MDDEQEKKCKLKLFDDIRVGNVNRLCMKDDVKDHETDMYLYVIDNFVMFLYFILFSTNIVYKWEAY